MLRKIAIHMHVKKSMFSIMNFINIIIMPNASKLTFCEKGSVKTFALSGMIYRCIAKMTGRSKTVSNTCRWLKNEYGEKSSGGRPKSLSLRDEREILKLA